MTHTQESQKAGSASPAAPPSDPQHAPPAATPPLPGTSDAWRADLLAGITNGILAIPQGIAFALIAGMPPEYGLYAMIVPTLISSLIHTNPFVSIGATNTSALVIGGMVVSLSLSHLAGAATDGDKLAIMLLIVLVMGMLQFGAALLRLGDIGRFVSQAVMVGFTCGAAALIGFGQIKNVLGVVYERTPHFHEEATRLFSNLGQWDGRTLTIGALTLASVAALNSLARRKAGTWVGLLAAPGMLWSIVLASGLVLVLDWNGQSPGGVRVIGEVPRSLPAFMAPSFDLLGGGMAKDILLSGVAIAILGAVETISIGKALSAQAGVKFDANRELLALGSANLTGGFFHCLPSSASWTRSAVNEQMGARTRWVGVVAALFVLAVVLALAPLAKHIPIASLGAIIIFVAVRMVKIDAVKYVWRWDRTDGAVMLITFFSMLAVPIQYAIYFGVFASLVMLVRRAGKLHVVEMAQAGGNQYREQEVDEHTGSFPVVLLQLEGDLFFGVVLELEERLQAIAANGATVMVLRMKRAHAIDATAADTLAGFAERYQKNGGRLILCGLKDDLYTQIARSHLGEVLTQDHKENLLRTAPRAFGSVHNAIGQAKEDVTTNHDWPAGKPMIRPAPTHLKDTWTYSI